MNEKKSRLLENRENVGDIELKINELRERLQRKKQLNQQLASQLSDANTKNNKQQQQLRPPPPARANGSSSSSQVAAIEPFNRQQQQPSANDHDDVTDFVGSKGDAKYQTLPHNTRFLPMHLNNNNNLRGSPTTAMMKGLKVASVPPQVAEKPALPPKPAVNYKPLLPPRQHPDKESPIESSSSSSPQPSSVE